MAGVMLGLLTLGAGLGLGLGLSEGTATHTATMVSSWHPCSSSTTPSGLQVTCNEANVDAKSYSSSFTVWFELSHAFPKDAAACMNAALDRAAPDGFSSDRADFEHELERVLRGCGVRGRL